MLETLERYHKDGLLHKQTHPTLDLTIWNYSPKVQYERLWDEITLQCRGLVTNSKGVIVARPFKKFFNYEEYRPEDIPNEDYVVYEKMDGSLGILFYYEYELSDERRYNIWFNNNYETGMENFFDPNNLPDYDNSYYEPTPKTKGEWILATRGSFTSPQAIKGKEILDRLAAKGLGIRLHRNMEAYSFSTDPKVQAEVQALIAEDMKKNPAAAAAVKDSTFSGPQGFGNIIGVGSNAVIENLTRQTDIQQQILEFIRTPAARTGITDVDFTKQPIDTRNLS